MAKGKKTPFIVKHGLEIAPGSDLDAASSTISVSAISGSPVLLPDPTKSYGLSGHIIGTVLGELLGGTTAATQPTDNASELIATTQYVSDVIAGTGQLTPALCARWEGAYTAVAGQSADWESVYNTTVANSAKWDLNVADITAMGNASANWNSVYTAVHTDSGDWQSTETTVRSNSADWASTAAGGWTDDGATVRLNTPTDLVGIGVNGSGSDLTHKLTVGGNVSARDTIYTTSGNSDQWSWVAQNSANAGSLNSTYTTLHGNSGRWDTAEGDITVVAGASANWDSVYANVNATSAKWQVSEDDLTNLANASADWNAAVVDVTNLANTSADWDSVYANVNATSAKWQINEDDLTNLANTSGDWNSVYTSVTDTSADWDSVYSTINVNSGTGTLNTIPLWATTEKIGDSILTQSTDADGGSTVTVAGSAVIQGDLTVEGEFVSLQTNIQVTSALEVLNHGTGPAVIVDQAGAQPVVDFRDDGISVLHIADGGNVGIGTTEPTKLLTVAGDISAQGSLFVSSESVEFDDGTSFTSSDAGRSKTTYTTLNENSAKWAANEDDVTNLANVSSEWDSTRSTVEGNSADWAVMAADITQVANTSANWDNAETTLRGNSARWEVNEQDIAALEADVTNIANTSADWDSVYANVNVTSAKWAANEDDLTNLANTSAEWDSTYTSVNAGSSDWDNAFTTAHVGSADWDSVYANVNTTSAKWQVNEDDLTNLANTSADWDSVYANVNATSAKWQVSEDDLTNLANTSADWDSVYANVNATSAKWQVSEDDLTNLANTSAEWDSARATLETTSAEWAVSRDDVTNLANTSADWDAVYTDVNDNSATWSWVAGSSATMYEDLTLHGNIVGATNNHLDIKSGKNIRLYLDNDDNSSFTKFQVHNGDDDTIFAIAESGNTVVGGGVLASSIDGLTVMGDISATANIFSSDGNSNEWNTAYAKSLANEADITNLANTSADWDSVYTTVNVDSADWNNTETTLRGNSARWEVNEASIAALEADATNLANISAEWDSVYSNVNAISTKWAANEDDLTNLANTSADWDSVYANVNTTSAKWQINEDDITVLAGVSSQWDSTRATVESNSARWGVVEADLTNVANTSADWDSVYANVNATSAKWQVSEDDLTNLANTSADWDSVYTTVNVDSADWNNTETTLRSNSGRWDINESSIAALEADATNLANISAEWNSVYSNVNAISAKWQANEDDLTNLANTSADWDSVYANVNTTSAKWQVSEDDLTNLANTSADWDSVYTSANATSAEWDSTRATVEGNSARWGIVEADLTNIANTSASWDSVYTSVTDTSADWDSTRATVEGNSARWGVVEADLTNVANTSADWDSVYTTVNVDSADWNNTETTLRGNSARWQQLEDDVTGVANTSADWESVYTTVNVDSADWNNTETTLRSNSARWEQVEDDITELAGASGGWNSVKFDVQSKQAGWDAAIVDVTNLANTSADWDSVYAVTNANSAKWQISEDDLTILANASADWDSVYAVTNANSAKWQVSEDDLTNLANASADWDSVYSNANTYSADWTWVAQNSASAGNLNSTYTTLKDNSGRWDSAEADITVVAGSSADWDSVYSNANTYSADWTWVAQNSGSNEDLVSVYTSVNADSGDWDNAFTTAHVGSADWGSAYTTLNDTSATGNIGYITKWVQQNKIGDSIIHDSGTTVTVAGSAVIQGDLTVEGDFVYLQTDVSVTSALEVTNHGTGPAVLINQKGVQPVIDIQDDGTSVLKIIDGGNVGIGEIDPEKTLTVAGDISAQGSIYTSNTSIKFADGTSFVADDARKGKSTYTAVNVGSADWYSAYTTAKANSADITNLANTSADWDSVYANVNATSAKWQVNEDDLTNLANTSADWDSVYANVNTTSAKWQVNEDDLTNLANTSADWDSAYTTVNADSADWNNTETTLRSNSSRWDAVEADITVVASSSADWDSVYANVNATSAKWQVNEDDLTNLANTSADWDSVYAHTNSLSTEWEKSKTTLRSNSGRWETNEASIAALEADATNLANISAEWNSVYSNVNAISAKWAANEDDLTNLANTSADWDSVYSNANTYSADWTWVAQNSGSNEDLVSVYTTVNAGTADWDSVYSSANATSADWNSIYAHTNSLSAEWEKAKTTVRAQSGDWASTAEGGGWTRTAGPPGFMYTSEATDTVSVGSLTKHDSKLTVVGTISATDKISVKDVGNSSDWSSVYTDVNANSSDWTWGASNSATMYEDLTVHGTITGPTNDDLDIKSGKNVSLYLDTDDNSAFCKFQVHNGDDDTIFAIAESGNAVIGAGVTANSIDGLTVIGDISASANVFTSGGNSNKWSSVYANVNTTSAKWAANEDDLTNLANTSADWDSVYSNANTYSADWTWVAQNSGSNEDLVSVYTSVNADSADWNSVYASTNTTSADWDSVYSTINANSGSGTEGYLLKWDSSGEQPADSQLFDSGGVYFGVGTNQVFDKLHVGSGNIRLENGYALKWHKTGDPTAYEYIKGDSTNGYISFYTGGAERARISGANVGIGTTSPSELLTVAGNITAQDTLYDSAGNSTQWRSTHTTVNASTANWDSVYSSANAASADWDSVYTTVNVDSADWNNTEATLRTASADWDSGGTTYTTLNVNSGRWESAYTSVNADSADWDSVYANVNTTSAKWAANEADITVLASTSADWDSVYSTINTNSGTGTLNTIPLWTTTEKIGDSVLSQAADADGGKTITVAGSAVVQGDLTVQGDFTYLNTDVRVTDQLDIKNDGTGPAIVANQTGSENIVDFQDDGTSVFKILDGGNITVKSGATVDGRDISADGAILDAAVVDITSIANTSADWDSVYANVNTTSAKWQVNEDDLTNLANTSADWDSVYANVNTTSAKWAANEDDLTNLANTSADWDSVYANVNTTSAKWQVNEDDLTNLASASADWDSAYTTAKANSADITNLANTSGDWNSIFSIVNAGSGTWENSHTTLGAHSGNWELRNTIVANNSANWDDAYTDWFYHGADWQTGHDHYWSRKYKYITTHGTVTALSANWSSVYTSANQTSADWDSVYANVNATSAKWAANEDDLTNLANTSADWDSVYANVNATSAKWAANEDDLTNLANTSADWDSAYTTAKSSSADITNLANTSADWDSVYANVNTTSAKWAANEDDLTNLANASADWDSTYTSVNNTSADWNSVYSSSNATSADWDSVYTSVTNESAYWVQTHSTFKAQSGGWEASEGIVNTGKNSWNTAYTDSQLNKADITTLEVNSGKWESVYSSANATSADWDSVYTTVNVDSADWNNTETTLRGNSARWKQNEDDLTNLANTSADWDHVYSTVNATSAKWKANEDDLTNLANTSADWDSVYSTVNANSGEGTVNTIPLWTTTEKIGDSILSQATATDGGNTVTVAGSAVIQGDLTVEGDFVYLQTDVSVTSALEVTNHGTGPAVLVNQQGVQPVVDFQDDGTSVFKIVDGGNVGIGEVNPEKTLTVAGDISAQGSIYTSNASIKFADGTSFVADDARKGTNTYTAVNAGSADWDHVYSTVNVTSAKWAANEDDLTNLANASADWDSVYAHTNSLSTEWEKAKTTLRGNSGRWDVNEASIAALEADASNLETDVTNVANTSADWDSVYTSVTDTSSTWDQVYSTVKATSAKWAGNEDDLTNLANTSADWDSVYAHTNSLSTEWEKAKTTLRSNSGDWETAHAYSQVGHLPLAGGTLTGDLIISDNVTPTLTIQSGTNLLPRIHFNEAGTDKWRIANSADDEIWFNALVGSGPGLYAMRINQEGRVGIQAPDGTGTLSRTLNVWGSIDATQSIFTSAGNSDEWSSVFTNVRSLSDKWDPAYTTAKANSADITNLATASADWDSVYTSTNVTSANWDSSYTTAKANSADITKLANASADWDHVYSTVNVTSAKWQVNEDDLTNLANASADWDSVYAHTNSLSTEWEKAKTTLRGNSGDWVTAKNTINGSASNWNTAYDILTDDSTPLNIDSGQLYVAKDSSPKVGIGTTGPSKQLTLETTTSSWIEMVRIVNKHATGHPYLLVGGPGYDEGITVGYINESNVGFISHTGLTPGADGIMIDTAGKIGIGTSTPSAQLEIDTPSTAVDTLLLGRENSKSSIKSADTHLLLDSAGGYTAINEKVTDDVVLVKGGGNVGIKIDSPDEALTVAGNISASNIIYTSGGYSKEWESVYTSAASASAYWDTTYTTVNEYSGFWSTTYADVTRQIDEWDNTWHTLTASSGQWVEAYEKIITQQDEWDNTWSTLTAESADWQTAYTDSQLNKADITNIANASADWDSAYTIAKSNSADITNIANTSADWDHVYSTVNVTSAKWAANEDDLTNLANASADWTSAYTTAKANSADITNLANASANWDSVYTSVTDTSGTWDQVYSTVKSTSGDWEIAHDQLTDTTTDINVDSGLLFVDKSEDRVGIGTSTPTGELHLVSPGPQASDWASQVDQQLAFTSLRIDGNTWSSGEEQEDHHMKVQYSDDNSTWSDAHSFDISFYSPGSSGLLIGTGDPTITWTSVGAHRYWRLTKTGETISGSGVPYARYTELEWRVGATDWTFTSSYWSSTGNINFQAAYINNNTTSGTWAADPGGDSTFTITLDTGLVAGPGDTLFVDDGKVGVRTASPTEALTVKGSISARDRLIAGDYSSTEWNAAIDDVTNLANASADWNSVYTSTNAISADSVSVYTSVNDASADWDHVYSTVNVTSAKWQVNEDDLTNLANASADWDSVYAHTNSLSTEWEKAKTTLRSNSGRWDVNEASIAALETDTNNLEADVTNVANTSADWDHVYSTVNTTSAKWAANEDDLTNLANASADWNSVYTSVTDTSSTWDQVYSTVKVTSAKWQVNEDDLTNLANASADWNSVYTQTNANSALWAGSVVQTIEVSNAFSTGDVIFMAVNGLYEKAIATTALSADALGVVKSANAGSFDIVYSGTVPIPSHGFSTGGTLFLSTTVQGALTETAPSTVEYIDKPMAQVLDANTIFVTNYRGIEITQVEDPTSTVETMHALSGGWQSTYATMTGVSAQWEANRLDLTEVADVSGQWNTAYSNRWELTDGELGTTKNVGIGKTNPAKQLDVDGTFRVSKAATFEGDLNVDSNNVYILDEKLYINYGGDTAESIGAGLYVDDGDNNEDAGYIRTNSDGGWELKELRSGNILTLGISGTKTIGVTGGLDIEADSAIDQDLTIDSTTVQFGKATISEIVAGTGYGNYWWDSAYVQLSNLSGQWDQAYNTVKANSGTGTANYIPMWTTQEKIGDSHISESTTGDDTTVTIAGSANITGSVTVGGSWTYLNTEVLVTDQVQVTNEGTGPAFIANQTGIQPVIDFQDDGTSVFYIEDGGNVGLGITDPTANLHIQRSSSGGDATLKLQTLESQMNTFIDLAPGTGGASYIRVDDTSVINMSPTSIYLLQNGGKVGIGTTIPSEVLTVFGNTYATGFLSAASLSADHVITRDPSSISYAPSGTRARPGAPNDYILYSDDVEYTAVDSSANADWHLMKSSPGRLGKNGIVRVEFTAKTTVGDSYWAWKITRNGHTAIESDGTTATGPYTESLKVGEAAEYSIYKTFVVEVRINPGDLIELYMVSSNVNGDAEAGSGQTLSVKDFRLYSGSPSLEHITTNLWGKEVGIGTATPAEQLEVIGNTRVTGSLSAQGGGYNYFANSVGIGTTTPIDALHVEGDIRTVGGGISLYRSDSNNWSKIVNPEGSGNLSPMAFHVGIGEAMRIDNTGNVGIGTTAPTRMLHLSGQDSGSTARMRISNAHVDSSSVIDFDNDAASAEMGIYGGSYDSFQIWTGTSTSAPRLTIKTDGNVGIGTTAPTSPLHLHADTTNGGYLAYLYNTGTESLDHGLNVQISSTSSTAYGLRVNTVSNTNALAVMGDSKVGIGTATPNETLTVVGNISADGNVTAGGSLSAQGLLTAGDGTNGANLSGALHIDGKVGINSTAPAVTFEINATDAMLVPAGGSGTRPAGNVEGWFRYNTDIDVFEGNTGTGWSSVGGVVDSDTDTRIVAAETGDDDTLRFYTDDAQRVAILSGGDVVIGPANAVNQAKAGGADPSERLTVSGNISASGSLSAIGSGPNYFAGKVGIGTTKPTALLDIHNDGSDIHIHFDGSSIISQNRISGHLAYGAGGTSLYRHTFGDGDFLIDTGTGRVGIGTTAPDDTLTVAGTVSANGLLTAGDGTNGANLSGNLQVDGNIEYEGQYLKSNFDSEGNDLKRMLISDGTGFKSALWHQNSHFNGSYITDTEFVFTLNTGVISAAHIWEDFNYVDRIGAVKGLVITNSGFKGAVPTFDVLYGSTIYTAASGNAPFTITGRSNRIDVDLAGSGGTTMAIGSGGSYNITLPDTVIVNELSASDTISTNIASVSSEIHLGPGGKIGIGNTSPTFSFDASNSSDAIRLPIGTDGQRDAITGVAGLMRFNTTDSIFEAHDGNAWNQLGGTADADRDTKIIGESSPGEDEDILYFFTDGKERARITKTGDMCFGTSTPAVTGVTIRRHLSVGGAIFLSGGKYSDQWSSVYTSVNETSAEWDSVYTSVNETSADWDSVYTSVNETSADWDSVYSSANATSGYWDSTYTTVHGFSGLWGDGPELGALSGHSNATYVATFSAESLSQARKWNSGVGYWSTNSLASFDNTKVNNEIYNDTSFNGAGAAVGAYVKLDAGQPLHGTKAAFTQARVWAQNTSDAHVWAVQYSDDDTTWITIDGASVTVQNGSGTGSWTYSGKHRYWRLINKGIEFPVGTVNYYEIQFYESILVNSQAPDSSIDWDSVYSTVYSTSAKWQVNEDDLTNLANASADWDSVYSSANATSANWDSVYTSASQTSADWDGAYTTARAGSADWNSVYTSVTDTSGTWDQVYSTVKSTSAKWQVNEDDLTNLANASGDWDSVYSVTNAHSGAWTQPLSAKSTGDTITVSHTLTAGMVIRKDKTGIYERSIASSDPINLTTDVLSAEVLGVVQWSDATYSSNVWSGSNFEVIYSGRCSMPDHKLGDPGATVFLSPDTLGSLTSACPSEGYQISKPVATIIDSDTILVQPMRGIKIANDPDAADDWDSAYLTVRNISGSWGGAAATEQGDSAYTTVNISSADWTWVAGNSATFYEDVLAKENVTIDGNLTVKGATTTLETSELHVEDKLVRLNKGGATNSGDGVGIEIEENNSATGYVKTDSNKDWTIKGPSTSGILTFDVNASATLTIEQDTLKVNKLNVSSPTVPANANASGTKGDIAYDNHYIYICVQTNTWRRSVLTTW